MKVFQNYFDDAGAASVTLQAICKSCDAAAPVLKDVPVLSPTVNSVG